MLKALAEGETNPTALAALADQRLRATPEQLCDALGACTDLKPVYRRLLKMALEQLQFLEQQIGQLDQEMASLLRQHQDAVERLAEVPGLGVDSAQQIIAEVGPTAATFPSEKCLSSWVGACPGDEESAGVNYSHRSPKGNRHMRRFLNQAANAAVKAKGTIFEIVYRRPVPRLGHKQAIGAIAHRQCRLIWLILHQGVRYEERGPAVTKRSKQQAHCENDPATPKPRLSDRTTEFSKRQSEHKRSDFRPCRSSSPRIHSPPSPSFTQTSFRTLKLQWTGIFQQTVRKATTARQFWTFQTYSTTAVCLLGQRDVTLYTHRSINPDTVSMAGKALGLRFGGG